MDKAKLVKLIETEHSPFQLELNANHIFTVKKRGKDKSSISPINAILPVPNECLEPYCSSRMPPQTKLRKFYSWLKEVPDGFRLPKESIHGLYAEHFAKNPHFLANLVLDAVEEYEVFENSKEDFYKADSRQPLQSKASRTLVTSDVQYYLSTTKSLTIGNISLEFHYVDYEVAPGRTTDPMHQILDSGSGQSGGMDVLMKLQHNDQDLPVVCEVKIHKDQTPLLGLVQALTYASELATKNQQIRLNNSYPEELKHLPSDPAVGVLLLFIDMHENLKSVYEEVCKISTGLYESSEIPDEFSQRIPLICIATADSQEKTFTIKECQLFKSPL